MENAPNLPLQPTEAIELEQQAVLHDMEVVARSLDMVPGHSSLGTYLSEPATKIVKGQDGHARVEDAGYSNYDEFKQNTAAAVDAFSAGKVAKIKLMHGMVNGHVDAHRGSSIKNLRYAFEDLRHMGITGSSGFHDMLNPRGRNLGNLEMDTDRSETSEANAALLAEGATRIRKGETAVMFNDHKGEPRTKMYGLTDPQTGELLKNAYLLVGSGTFSDKEGTTSNFSNLAWADVVLIPEDKFAAQEAAVVPESQPATQVEPGPFDIDKVDWTPFQHSTFKVKRTGGAIDVGGWNLREVKEANGTHYGVITAWSPQGTMEKTVRMEDLVRWQSEEE